MAGAALTRVRTADIRSGLTITHMTTGRRYTIKSVHPSAEKSSQGWCIVSGYGVSGDTDVSVSFRVLRTRYLRRNLRALL